MHLTAICCNLQLTYLLNIYTYMHTHTHTHTHTYYTYGGHFSAQVATNGCTLRYSNHARDLHPFFGCCNITKLQQL